MAAVYIFMVDAGSIWPSAFCANSVSPLVREMTIAPHWPDRVRAFSASERCAASSPESPVRAHVGAGGGLGAARTGLRAGGLEAVFFVTVAALPVFCAAAVGANTPIDAVTATQNTTRDRGMRGQKA